MRYRLVADVSRADASRAFKLCQLDPERFFHLPRWAFGSLCPPLRKERIDNIIPSAHRSRRQRLPDWQLIVPLLQSWLPI